MNGFDYEATVVRLTDGRYAVRIKELFLIEEDADLAAAWARIEARTQELVERHRRAGAETDLPRPVAAETAGGRDLRRFALKAAIVALAATVFMVATAAVFSYAVREPMRKVGLKVGRAALARVEEGLRDAARDELTPERAERIRLLVADAAPKLKPYVAELRPLFQGFCEPSQ